MPWTDWLSCFFGAAFLVNAIPHLAKGTVGEKFPTVFSSPPGIGLSSPLINVLWGLTNIAAAYGLLSWAVTFEPHRADHIIPAAFGAIVIGVYLASHFGKVLSR